MCCKSFPLPFLTSMQGCKLAVGVFPDTYFDPGVNVSHQQSKDHPIVLALPQHLSFKLHLPMFPGSHQNPNHLIRNAHISVEQFAERDACLSVRIWVGHSPDDVTHVGYLAVDVLFRTLGSLRRLRALFGASVALLALLEAEGHGVVVVKVFAEGVQFLVHGVLRSPVLPAALQVSHRAVLFGKSIDLVGVFGFLFIPTVEKSVDITSAQIRDC